MGLWVSVGVYSVYGYFRIFMSLYACLWVYMDVSGFLWVYGYLWVSWVSIGVYGHL